MRAFQFDGSLRLQRDHPIPEPSPGEVLLRVRRAGICNTDLELFRGMYGFRGIPGHEFVGEVMQGPPDWIGRRAVGEINVVCGDCDQCRKGVSSQCRRRRTVGIRGYAGAFADFLVMPLRNLHWVPDSVTDDQAVFVEPLAAALQIPAMVSISPGDRVVVLGAGKLGLLVAQVLKLHGVDLAVVVRRERQRHLLQAWDIATASAMDFDDGSIPVVVDCTGRPEGFSEALRMVEPRGTIVLKSTYAGIPSADLNQIAIRELHVVGSRCGPFPAALRLLSAGLIQTADLIEACYPLDSALDAVAHAGRDGVLKVLLAP